MSLPTLGRKCGLFATETQRLTDASDHLYKGERKKFLLVCQAFFLTKTLQINACERCAHRPTHLFNRHVRTMLSPLLRVSNASQTAFIQLLHHGRAAAVG